MKKVFTILLAVLAFSIAANASEYTLDESGIDAIIESAVAVTPSAFAAELPAGMPAASPATLPAVGQKSPAAALLLTFFLGEFGVHRHYLGTRPWMWAIYTFTVFGIFGIVPLVDFIVEIVAVVDGVGLGQYIGNTKFIMWG